MSENDRLREQREYAWNYFHLHAGQRMSLFNFFVLMCALLTTGLAGTFRKDCDSHALGLVLGLSLSVISFAFWKIEQRVRHLIKNVEDTLKILEESWNAENADDNNHTALFSKEEQTTKKRREGLRKKHKFAFYMWDLSYYDCFCIVYFVFGAVGIIGMIASIVQLTQK